MQKTRECVEPPGQMQKRKSRRCRSRGERERRCRKDQAKPEIEYGMDKKAEKRISGGTLTQKGKKSVRFKGGRKQESGMRRNQLGVGGDR